MTTLAATFNSAPVVAPAFEKFTTLLSCCGAALRCASAVEGGRMPAKRDLDLLGIADIMPRTYRTGR